MRILSLLFVLLLACADAQAQQWSEYQSPTGRYRIEMPGTPAVTTAQVSLTGGGTAPMVQAVVEIEDSAYVATHTDYAPSSFSNGPAQDALAKVRDGSAAGKKLLGDRTFSNSGYPAREYVIESTDGTTLVVRSALARNRLYQMIAVYRTGKAEPPGVRRFINSFTILPQ